MKLQIGVSKHNWIPFDISIGQHAFSFRASTVLNDPIFVFLAAVM